MLSLNEKNIMFLFKDKNTLKKKKLLQVEIILFIVISRYLKFIQHFWLKNNKNQLFIFSSI